MAPEISAVICTHNRVPYLIKAVNSLDRQSLIKSRYEVIVVDNCSSDGTRELVAGWKKEMGNLRYLFEPSLGLSAARNRGLSESKGNYIAFLDDDAVADADWLEWAIRIHKGRGDDLGFLGGRVRPIWEADRPAWLSDDLLPFLSITDLGEAPIEVEGASGLVGASMVFKRQVLQDAGGFPQALGRKGAILLSNEELQLKKHLQQKGLVSLYHPNLAVSHHIFAERATKPWFRRRLYWQGRSDAVWWRIDTGASVWRRTKRVATSSVAVAKAIADWLLYATFKREQGLSFSKECRILLELGNVAGLVLSYEH